MPDTSKYDSKHKMPIHQAVAGVGRVQGLTVEQSGLTRPACSYFEQHSSASARRTCPANKVLPELRMSAATSTSGKLPAFPASTCTRSSSTAP